MEEHNRKLILFMTLSILIIIFGIFLKISIDKNITSTTKIVSCVDGNYNKITSQMGISCMSKDYFFNGKKVNYDILNSIPFIIIILGSIGAMASPLLSMPTIGYMGIY